MPTTTKATFLLVFLILFLTAFNIRGQVAVIDYVKISQDKVSEYLKLEERWQAVHEARLEKGLIISWGLYEVMFTGTADLYNYATVTVYDNLDMYDRSWDINFLTESYPEMDDHEIDEFYRQTVETKNLVRNVVLSQLISTATDPGKLPAYVLVNGMKVVPGGNSEYLAMERDVFKPIHEEGIKQNARAGWALWEKFYGGNYSDFQYVTFDAYYSFKQIEDDITPPLFKKLHPNKDFNDVLKSANNIRTIVSREIWRILAFVEANGAE
jgi:hypothetical protein